MEDEDKQLRVFWAVMELLLQRQYIKAQETEAVISAWLPQADEMVRRNKDRDERLKALLAEAAKLSAETKRLEQQRAQLEGELAEAHRERCCNVTLRPPVCWPLGV